MVAASIRCCSGAPPDEALDIFDHRPPEAAPPIARRTRHVCSRLGNS
jgi:hypothetical protein